MAQFKFLLWLVEWYTQTDHFEFDWDTGNMFKSLEKHSVEISEVESVFRTKKAFAMGIQVSPQIDTEDRFSIVGLSENNNILSLVFTLRGHRVRPISSRLASRAERKVYESLRKKT